MRDYIVYMGSDSLDYFNALMAYKYNPTKTNQERIDSLTKVMDNKARDILKEAKNKFIQLYGEDTYRFIKSIKGRKYTGLKHIKSWDDPNNEDSSFDIEFINGKFVYKYYMDGGYSGTKVLEDNLTIERVLQIIKEHEGQ